MVRLLKCRYYAAKYCVVLVGLLLITLNAYAQEPVWDWAVNAGGTDMESGYSISNDTSDNLYITGVFSGSATFGPYSITSIGYSDIFVAKNYSGENWQWATRGGGYSFDTAICIAVDDSGNSYITGNFTGTAIFGSTTLITNIGCDIFVAKLDENGDYVWALQAGEDHGNDKGHGLVVDTNGNSYLTGYFQNTASFGSFSITSSGDSDVYIAKIDSGGNWLWVTQAGGIYRDIGYDITIDGEGNCYINGTFEDTAYFDSCSLESAGMEDIFVAKVDGDGNWIWATRAGGTIMDGSNGISIDYAGNAYVTGSFYDTATFGSYDLTSSGYSDIYVAKINSSGNWQWAKKAGGIIDDYGYDIAIDNFENCYVTGSFKDTASFGPINNLISNGHSDIFVGCIDSESIWQWATQAGGIHRDAGNGITLDYDRNIYITGSFTDTAIFGSYSLTSYGLSDIFVAKLNSGVSVDQELNLVIGNISNFPNPFDQRTMINYALKREAEVSLEIYNIKGQLVETLFEGTQQPGDHTIEWDCQDMPSGVYFFKMQAGDESFIRKMILLR